MTTDEVISQLRSVGTAQNRKVFARHGMGDAEHLGASYAEIDKLARKLRKPEHGETLHELWKSGIHDARAVVCRAIDPTAIDFTIHNAGNASKAQINFAHRAEIVTELLEHVESGSAKAIQSEQPGSE